MVRLSTFLGFALATASVLIPGVLSQDIPACGKTCAQQAASTSVCSASDYSCICTDLDFADSFGTCLGLSCSPADAQTAIDNFYAACEDLIDPGPSTSVVSDPSIPTDTSTPTHTTSPKSTEAALPTSTPATQPGGGGASVSPANTRSPASVVSPASTRSPASVVSPTTGTLPTSISSNHATHNQPAGVLGAGFALALALFA